ncbi:MAG: hypothetical protein M3Q23_12275 [Actinomycetota bacterium]|nr:hypothetical protein [Actinomycetota bacterium]
MRRGLFAIAGLALVAALAVPTAVQARAGARAARAFPIHLHAHQLAPLDGAFYELWTVFGSQKLSAGAFNVDEDGNLVDGFGHPARFFSTRNPAHADALVVTVEPSPDPDLGPSGIAILVGSPHRHRAPLSFPANVSNVAGSFILATPTDQSMSDETSGLWFLDPTAGPGPSLSLPTLPSGWVWEGWGVTQGVPLSSGRFTQASGADRSAQFSGPLAGPPFPGEDFLTGLPAGVTSPVNLADGSSMAVVTIEPDLNGNDPTGPGPFSIKPLAAAISPGAADHTSIMLHRDLSTVPSGAATF